MIVNCGIPSGLVSYERDELISQFIELICDSEYRDLTVQEETFGSYPAYRLSWLSGENEDTRHWDARLVCTDTYLYIYAFDTAADYAEEMAGTWQETLDGLESRIPRRRMTRADECAKQMPHACLAYQVRGVSALCRSNERRAWQRIAMRCA